MKRFLILTAAVFGMTALAVSSASADHCYNRSYNAYRGPSTYGYGQSYHSNYGRGYSNYNYGNYYGNSYHNHPSRNYYSGYGRNWDRGYGGGYGVYSPGFSVHVR